MRSGRGILILSAWQGLKENWQEKLPSVSSPLKRNPFTTACWVKLSLDDELMIQSTLVISKSNEYKLSIQKGGIFKFAWQSRRGSEICKTPGWAVRPMKSSPLQIERIWRSSLMRWRQFMVLRAQEPPVLSVQMELVFWLTKRLSWRDGLSTLIVFLIGHHLSMMTRYQQTTKDGM